MAANHDHCVLHDNYHHFNTYRRVIAAVFAITFSGDRLEAEALLADAECLLCCARALLWCLAAGDDSHAVETRGLAWDQLEVILGVEPPEDWDALQPESPGYFGTLA